MIVTKTTIGFVCQRFDTSTGKWIDQEFIAGDSCDYEDANGEPCDPELLEVDDKEAYLPFEMKQPT